MIIGYIIIGLVGVFGWFVQNKLKKKFKQYSELTLKNGMSGREIAEKMLADNGILDVKVISTPGRLTDHYNPGDKTVNLSEAVYGQRNAAAAAVAAHEVGHAIQHATAYSWLQFRSKMVPTVNMAGKISGGIIMAGLFLQSFPILLPIGIALFAATVVFTFVTLPVDYDASNRALIWLDNENMLTPEEHAGAKDALSWAARTYVVAAIGALASLLYYVMIYMGRD
jgi:Zn-dependent membrane protease YugP